MNTSSRTTTKLDHEGAIRAAAAEFGVDLPQSPSPLEVAALVAACMPGGCSVSDLWERAEELMKESLPTFGWVHIELASTLGGCLGQHGIDALDDLTPGQLRDLAADAVRAAEWIEAHR